MTESDGEDVRDAILSAWERNHEELERRLAELVRAPLWEQLEVSKRAAHGPCCLCLSCRLRIGYVVALGIHGTECHP